MISLTVTLFSKQRKEADVGEVALEMCGAIPILGQKIYVLLLSSVFCLLSSLFMSFPGSPYSVETKLAPFVCKVNEMRS